MKAAGSGELGCRIEDAVDDHGDDEVALAAGEGVEDGIELEEAQATKDSSDMAMREGTGDGEGSRQRESRRRNKTGNSGAFEDKAEGFDLLRGPMREVGDGAVFDFAVEAEGFTEEDGGGRVAVGDGGHIHDHIIYTNPVYSKYIISSYMTTQTREKLTKCLKTNEVVLLAARTSG